jgi:hypothetical protein
MTNHTEQMLLRRRAQDQQAPALDAGRRGALVAQLRAYLRAGGEDYTLAAELSAAISWTDPLCEALNDFIYRGRAPRLLSLLEREVASHA